MFLFDGALYIAASLGFLVYGGLYFSLSLSLVSSFFHSFSLCHSFLLSFFPSPSSYPSLFLLSSFLSFFHPPFLILFHFLSLSLILLTLSFFPFDVFSFCPPPPTSSPFSFSHFFTLHPPSPSHSLRFYLKFSQDGRKPLLQKMRMNVLPRVKLLTLLCGVIFTARAVITFVADLGKHTAGFSSCFFPFSVPFDSFLISFVHTSLPFPASISPSLLLSSPPPSLITGMYWWIDITYYSTLEVLPLVLMMLIFRHNPTKAINAPLNSLLVAPNKNYYSSVIG